jgi:hypothetical protein
VSAIYGSHVEDGTCWCEDSERRVHALDVLYPDRCQEALLMDRTCVLPADHTVPCRGSNERPGDPCHYCGVLTSPTAVGPCSACWTSLEGLTMADLKGILANADLDVTPSRSEVSLTRLSRAELLAQKVSLEAHIKDCCGAQDGVCRELSALEEVKFLLGGDAA